MLAKMRALFGDVLRYYAPDMDGKCLFQTLGVEIGLSPADGSRPFVRILPLRGDVLCLVQDTCVWLVIRDVWLPVVLLLVS